VPRPLPLFSLLVLASCGGGSPEAGAPSQAPVRAPSGSPVETYFPLEQGKMYTYETRDGAETGIVSMRVERRDPAHGKLVVVGTSSAKRFVYDPEGVRYEGGAYILKAPIEVGSSWPGEHGGTAKIASTDASVTAGGKTYASCVQTVEDGTRPPGSRFVTTYCPGVGMVLFEVVTNQGDARGELKSYGAPIEIQQGTSVTIEKSQ
jgi:hypothetical protein